ncbi:UNVERIFIED_CONTAM: hypothetical protein FKN15_014098 [Acipenser sinensis]
MVQPQSLSIPVVQQHDTWDVDAISRDASEGEPLLKEDSVEVELASHHSESEMEVLDTNDPLWITEVHLRKGYSAAAEAVRLSNVASLLSVYQTALVKDLPEYPSVSLRTELGLDAQLLVKLAQLNAWAQGRSIAFLVVARRQLSLSQVRVQEPDKAPLLDAPITPGHTFGPAVEEMLQCSAKVREASQQMAKMWPHKPFQHKLPQEMQKRPGGTKTSPSSTAACGQPPFIRPQRAGWHPRGGGRQCPRDSGQAPRERAQPKQR